MQKKRNNDKSMTVRIMSLVTVALILAAGAVLRNGKLFGHEIGVSPTPSSSAARGDTITVQPDGSITVNTKYLTADVQGYGGAVPLSIHISKDGIVEDIKAEDNAETPEFFDRAKQILDRWKGKSVAEARSINVDAVSGATFSSNAIIENMKRGLAYANKAIPQDNAQDKGTAASSGTTMTVASLAALIVALLGAVVPLKWHSRRLHYVQLALNIVVLGLWTGTFVSFSLFMRLFSGGVSAAQIATLAAPLVMVVVALLYPIGGRTGHYCAHICPLGSAQELAGKITSRKPRVPQRVNKALTVFRHILWGILLLLMITGTWTAWMDYELFSAFLYSSASVWVIAVAALFLIVSVWIPRPYCRFVCPTGTMIKI